MDSRREPRFQIHGPVKVTSLSEPERELACVLLDVSATGIKLVCDQSLPVDDIIAIEAEEHLALADVRYSQPRGDKYTIGVERIHLAIKASLPTDKPKIERIHALVGDYRNRIRTAIATPRARSSEEEVALIDQALFQSSEEHAQAGSSLKALPGPGPYATREKMLEAAVGWAIEQWEKIPGQPQPGPPVRSEIIDRLTIHLAERMRPQQAKPAEAAPPLRNASMPASPPKVAEPPKPAAVMEPFQPPAFAKSNVPVKKVQPPLSGRKLQVLMGVAAAALLGWGLSSLFWSSRTSDAATRLFRSFAATTQPPSAPASPAPSAAGARHAEIKVIEPALVIATADGKRLFGKKLPKDDIKEIEFSEKAVVRVGNAAGVEISLDGKSIGPLGNRGQTKLVELSRDGFRFLPLN